MKRAAFGWTHYLLIAAILLLSLLLVASPSQAATTRETLVGETFVAGEANCFAVTNSTYLNVTVCSQETINATLESLAELVSFTVRPVTAAMSTTISVSGLVAGRTYHHHQDGHVVQSFVAAEGEGYAFTQDLSGPHHVYLSERQSTIFLRDDATGGHCTVWGSWDGPSKTCTLTRDTTDVIVIDSNGITLDGAGYKVGGYAYSWHVYASQRTGLTIKNAIMPDTCSGIALYFSTDSTVSGNKITSCYFGMTLQLSSGITVSGNSIWAAWYPFTTYQASGLALSGNTINGFRMEYSNDNTISGNYLGGGALSNSNRNLVLTNRFTGGISLVGNDNTFDGNTMVWGISVDGTRNLVASNDITGVSPYAAVSLGGTTNIARGNTIRTTGIVLGGTYNTVEGNTILNTGTAVYIGTYGHTVRDNVISTSYTGIQVTYGGSETIAGNTISASSTGIALWGSCCSTVISKNTITGGSTGISLYYYSQWNTIVENKITGSLYGISLGFDSSNNIVTKNTISNAGTGIHLSEVRGTTVSFNLIANSMNLGMNLIYASSNRLYENCFVDNARQLSNYGYPLNYNTWQNLGRGNYWSDYRGTDNNGDGIGDTNLPHQGADFFPLMSRTCGNTVPRISAFTATTSFEGSPTVFSVTASDPENNPLTFDWDYENDGVIDTSTLTGTATRTWLDDHTGTARVVVSDGQLAAEATVYVTVLNAAPDLTVTDGPVAEGQPLQVSFRAMDPGSDDLTVRIYWGDGTDELTAYQLGPTPDALESTDGTSRDVAGSFSRIFGDDSTLSAILTATDDDGGTATQVLTLVVLNGEPQITVVDLRHGVEGSPLDLSATAEDPGSDDLTFCWDFDDGQSECRAYLSGGVFPFSAADGGQHAWGDDGEYNVVLTVTDDDGGSTEWTQAATIANVAPDPSVRLDAVRYLEGSSVQASADFLDPGSDDVTLTWSWALGPTATRAFLNGALGADPPKSPAGVHPFTGSDSMSYAYPDNGVFPLTVTACDDDGGCLSESVDVIVENAAPAVSILGPSPGQVYPVGQQVTFSGTFSDAGPGDTHVAVWTFGSVSFEGTVTESGGSGTVTDTFTFPSAGVYQVVLTVLDDDGGVGTADTVGQLTAFIVVYDPQGGYVTGGGWVDSPAGAYVADPTLTGKATFGFTSKYQKGATVPTGETAFRFRVANLHFESASYEWLVVSGARAQYKGSGTVNGEGDYGFLLTVVDGALSGGGGADKFRIKIWDRATGAIVYDNQIGSSDFEEPATTIGAGSIIIHSS